MSSSPESPAPASHPAPEGASRFGPAIHVPLPFLLLSGLFVAALVTCNLIANKFVSVDIAAAVSAVAGGIGLDWQPDWQPLVVSAGILPYPFTFLVTDLLSEVYGRRRANQVVLTGFVVSAFVLGALWLGDQFPAIDGSPVDDATYAQAFRNAPRVILASMVAYLTAQLIDVRLFHFWKRKTRGRHLWLRNNASTVTSQLVDTVLVVSVLFVGTDNESNIPSMVADGWLFKVLWAALDTPLVYAAVWCFRRFAPTPELLHAD